MECYGDSNVAICFRFANQVTKSEWKSSSVTQTLIIKMPAEKMNPRATLTRTVADLRRGLDRSEGPGDLHRYFQDQKTEP